MSLPDTRRCGVVRLPRYWNLVAGLALFFSRAAIRLADRMATEYLLGDQCFREMR
jgi:hypothetical protein